MRKFCFFVIGFLVSTFASAQEFPSEIWHNGKVVLLSEDTIVGQLKYDFQNDLVQVNIQNVLQTYGARKLLYFQLYDETIKTHRHFYALPYNVQPNYKVPILFEALFEGKLSLLCREEIVTESMPNYNTYPYSYYSYPGNQYYNQSRTRLKYTYYFLDQNGEIRMYNLKKNELMSFFPKYQQEVKQYIKKNKLEHDSIRDLVRLTAYYNALLGDK
jgi:hypothetical protein